MPTEDSHPVSASDNLPLDSGGSETPGTLHEDHAPRRAYFVQGEINLQVEHKVNVKSVVNWDEWANKAWNTAWQRHSEVAQELVEVFSQENFSISVRSVRTMYTDNAGRAQSMIRISLTPFNLLEKGEKRAVEDDRAVIATVNVLNAGAGMIIDDMSLSATTPNWLFSGAGHVFTDGGPGGLPVPVPGGGPTPNQYQFDKTEVDRIIAQCNANPGKAVTVVIFDAVPPEETSIPLTLKIVREGDLGIQLPQTPEQNQHHHYTHRYEYEMSDHGLFIAGTIRDFAPDADIYLVEVLNHYGVGTIETLTAGFDALSQRRGRFAEIPKENIALIVNCSLCMECPAPNDNGEIILANYDGEGNEIPPPMILYSPEQVFEPLRTAVDRFYQQFAALDVQIVAAAGNNGEENVAPPPPATYPAALDSVLGVGAMESAYQRAWYSNLADVQPYDGVMVYGGKGNHIVPNQAAPDGLKEWSETDSAEGMLGVYIGAFPPKPNPQTGEVTALAQASSNGWGRWSGTSFATGVMSGILAHAATGGCAISLKKPGNFYQKLHADPSTRRTQYGEVIISAPQGQVTTVAPPVPMAPPTFLEKLLKAIVDFFNRLIGRA
jgi:hypothetical protein